MPISVKEGFFVTDLLAKVHGVKRIFLKQTALSIF